MDYYQDYSGGAGNGSNGQEARGTASIPGRDDDKKLFVGGLSRQTTDKELREYFSKYGEIESVTVKMDPFTGLSRRFAFIVFNNPQTIDKLLQSGDHYIQNRKVDPKRVSKKPQHGKIFVGGLIPEITDEDVKNYFSKYGTIVEYQAPFDKVKNQRKGFCFITFDSKDTMYSLLKNPKQTIKGKEVDVKKVRINPELGPGGRGRMPPGWGPHDGFGGPGFGYDYPPFNYGNGYDYSPNNWYGGGSTYDQGGFGGGKPKSRQFSRHQPY